MPEIRDRTTAAGYKAAGSNHNVPYIAKKKKNPALARRQHTTVERKEGVK